jgi:hypothetical protein
MKVIIGADISQLQSEMAKAGGVTQAFANKATAANVQVGTSLQKLGGAAKEAANSAISTASSFVTTGLVMAGIGAAIYVASKAFDIIKKDFISTSNAAEISGKKIKEYNDIVKSVTESVAKETTETIGLLSVLNNETETRDRKLSAIKELQKIQPEIFKGLKLEGEAVIGLDEAYKSYLINLRSVIAAKIIQAQIEASITELLKIQGGENTKQQQAQLDFLKNAIALNPVLSETKKALQDTKLAAGFLTDKQSANRVEELTEKIKGLFEKLKEFSNTVKVKELKVKVNKVKVEPDEIELLPPRSGILPQSEPTGDPKKRTTGTEVKILVTPKIEFLDNPEGAINTDEFLKKLNLEAFKKEATDAINETISNIINDTISNVAESIGDALAGGKDVVPRLFDNIIKGIGQQIKELGKYLVKIGLEKLAIDKAIQALGLNPAATIAVGFAAQILGSLLISAAQKKSSSLGSGFASGTTGVQQGGIFNVGERGPERIFLPAGASVQPNNELQAFGGGGQVFIPAVTLSGPDLVIAFNRASQQMGRNN